MPKRSETKKVPLSVTISEDVSKKLNDFCKENFDAPKSSVVEKALKKFLEGKP